jgi:tetratricopeptide (TPR) repeat protein
MARNEWYRNTEWNDEIEANFLAKLARARDKAQYLRIQACTLARTHPQVALRLLDRYFALGEDFDFAQAHVDRATAYLALDDVKSAIESYESALSREAQRPTVQTQASIELPFVVAVHRIKEVYERALEVLEISRGRLMFPVDSFRWHAAQALIALESGRVIDARQHAMHALAAADREHSGFRYHPEIGLVDDRYELVCRKLREVVGPHSASLDRDT